VSDSNRRSNLSRFAFKISPYPDEELLGIESSVEFISSQVSVLASSRKELTNALRVTEMKRNNRKFSVNLWKYLLNIQEWKMC
jgi:hypothetical protein